jgi:hypothetical protein
MSDAPSAAPSATAPFAEAPAPGEVVVAEIGFGRYAHLLGGRARAIGCAAREAGS